jgi:Family of unknown function (DUF5995)
MSLQQILTQTPVDSIAEAIAVMTTIDQTLPENDGVKWFNRLYLRVTVSVGKAVDTSHFHDPAFLSKLDVVFSNLYFSALTAGLASVDSAPSAWRPRLAARNRRGIARIQFALAGMNAHINRDLPDGIVQSFVALGGDPITDDLREQDFNGVNDLLEQVEREVKTEFAVGAIEIIDRLSGDVDDAVAMWNVRAARSAAWTNAQVLWGLRPLPFLRDRFFRRLDSLVGMSGRGLLLPRDPLFR